MEGIETLLDAAEVATILGVSRQWIRDHTTRIEPIIPHVRMGRKVRFRLADIKRFIDTQTETRPKWERSA
jgi:excisionase family DNA binding protein